MNDPGIAQNPARMVEIAKEHGKLGRQLAKYQAFRSAQKVLDETAALAEADDRDLRALAEAELPSLLTSRNDALEQIVSEFLSAEELAVESMILEIRAGTGGDEAGLFAGDLAEMYRRFCEQSGWKFDVLDFSPGEVGGFREFVANIKGEGAYRALAFEGGGHRVQRVPTTETQGRIHTSAATVAILPEADESAIEIDPADVREDVSRAGGPGGQGVNKIESAVQLTHLPTNIVVRMREERSQHKNRDKAWRLLRSRVFEHFDSKRRAERAGMRKAMIGSGDRNERIRTYNFPQNRCTDHRINQNFPLEKVISGDMSDLIAALQAYDRHERLADLAAS
jgi:peptide chain release factor 1